MPGGFGETAPPPSLRRAGTHPLLSIYPEPWREIGELEFFQAQWHNGILDNEAQNMFFCCCLVPIMISKLSKAFYKS